LASICGPDALSERAFSPPGSGLAGCQERCFGAVGTLPASGLGDPGSIPGAGVFVAAQTQVLLEMLPERRFPLGKRRFWSISPSLLRNPSKVLAERRFRLAERRFWSIPPALRSAGSWAQFFLEKPRIRATPDLKLLPGRVPGALHRSSFGTAGKLSGIGSRRSGFDSRDTRFVCPHTISGRSQRHKEIRTGDRTRDLSQARRALPGQAGTILERSTSPSLSATQKI
jgi:hypothetical protein